MTTILVAGGTGTLGAPTVSLLRAAGHDVRALSRRTAPDLVTGDLLSGTGIREAVDGVDTVIHLATGLGRTDVAGTRTLLAAAARAKVAHFLLISIVGVDDIPMGYYRGKVTVERMVRESGLPHTILRATQFHNLVDQVFRVQRFLPVILAPAFRIQPIDVRDVAERLAELVGSGPSGRVPDIGGPEQRTGPDLALAWKRAHRSRRAITPVKPPGRTFAGFAAGHNLVPGPPYGRRTFDDYLAERARGSGSGPAAP